MSRGSEEKKNRWRAEKLEATRETWALLWSFAFGSRMTLSADGRHIYFETALRMISG